MVAETFVAPTTSFWINVTNELSSVNTSKTVVDVGAGSPSSTSSVQSAPVLLGTVPSPEPRRYRHTSK